VIYNWGFNSAYGGEGGSYNIVGNYYKSGPATNPDVANRIVQPLDTTGKWYVAGNTVTYFPDVTANNWLGVAPGGSLALASIRRAEVPFPAAPIPEQSPEEAYLLVLRDGGASLPRRDPIDVRITQEVRRGTATFGGTYRRDDNPEGYTTGIIDSQTSVGGWPALRSSPPPLDSDHDGMPDSWETLHGLNRRDPTDGPTLTGTGYSNLEIYLNSIVGGEQN
jgi:pectate lyase